MAQKVQVLLVDDVDGGEAAETLSFSFAGTDYEIDLSEKNADEFRAQMSKWVESARRTGGRRQPKPKAPQGPRPAATLSPITGRAYTAGYNRDAREWARGEGIEVPGRGRVPGRIITAYEEAKAAGKIK